jgi:uncharacterized protein (UPF0254 family)
MFDRSSVLGVIMKTKLRNSVVVAAVLSVAASGVASAADFVLPTPDNSTAVYGMFPDATGTPRQAILMDGIPIAFKYDDFWS